MVAYMAFLEKYPFLKEILNLLLVLALIYLTYMISKHVVFRLIKKMIYKTKTNWDDILLKNKLFNHLLKIIPTVLIYHFSYVGKNIAGYDMSHLIRTLSSVFLIYTITMSVNAFLTSIVEIYYVYDTTRQKPIKGYVQVLKIIIYIIGLILIISAVMNKSPLMLLSGIGAMTAILLLIFKDTILSFIASIQLHSNNMLKIGDWIEMPGFNADGDVIDIALHTVKIQNWDKSITTIPTQKFIENSFKNYRGMIESGGRRINRSLHIDVSSIKFMDDALTAKLKRISILKSYLDKTEKEIKAYNSELNIDMSSCANGRRMTNIGTFRIYIEKYLENHSGINKDFTLMVRQMEPTVHGLELQLYAFAKETNGIMYEKIQSDIFDHLFGIIHEFELRIFQNPSGNDIKTLLDAKTQD